jgi:quercetin dioxygenase-like cupin family protein
MSGFTVRNLREIEDSAPAGGLAPGLEARFGRKPLEAEASGLTYFRIAPGHRVPLGHRHAEQEETYLVLTGRARVALDDEVRELGPWDAVRIAPATMRGIEAGPEGAEVLAFGAGPAGDADTQPGWWSPER